MNKHPDRNSEVSLKIFSIYKINIIIIYNTFAFLFGGKPVITFLQQNKILTIDSISSGNHFS